MSLITDMEEPICVKGPIYVHNQFSFSPLETSTFFEEMSLTMGDNSEQIESFRENPTGTEQDKLS